MDINTIQSLISENYRIEIKDITVINRLLFRQSFLLNTSNGQYVLKYYPRNFSIDQIKLINEFSKCLIKRGMNTLSIISLNNGNLHISIPNGVYVLYDYLPGVKSDISDISDISVILRGFHDISSLIKEEEINATKETLKIDWAISELDKYLKYTEDDDFITKISNYKYEIINSLNSYKLIDNIIVHGDFTLNNVIKEDKIFKIIDLDTIRLGNRLDDLACLSLSLCYSGNNKIKFNRNYGQIAYLLQSYFGDQLINQELVNDIVEAMKLHCSYELIKHAENFHVLKRYTGMLNYLNMLLDVITENEMEENIWKQLLEK
ncbi:aminoglycoside phosphotransferase family protein [Robertmurraya kyonggiensis]|uniref:Aminoglycoside phosphotransferase family protein n=1 Tax=Robertmurraya kyonggiensis TaxID=1037680 RepID=A0A4U1DBV1_9BACI|nr:aminoglycoside phosphotransferase family protein [Robertmurraya kyonggiensis]TKC19107.1 aminoglycoside phosphotransferase family protein [Robertmurraya kyonggiensis]